MKDVYDHLGATARVLARFGGRPATLVLAAIAVAVVLSWVMLVLMAVRAAELIPGGIGPGSSLLGRVSIETWPEIVEFIVRGCLQPQQGGGISVSLFLAYCAMWTLMGVAMMLPSAAPMIRTYCEIADTAAAKGEHAVHPLVLVLGYLTVWTMAAVVFSIATLGLQSAGAAAGETGALRPVAAAIALAFAGAYQFSALKDACLEKCRNPFAVLFSRWSISKAAIFRLGVDQGMWCLGCCWALMLVMFAVGIMNVFWMALIGIFAIVEKGLRGRFASQAAGALLLVWAAALLVISA